MPDELQTVRYPCIYKCNDDGKWHCLMSDTEEIITKSHPCFDKDIISRHEEFGYTLSQWRKKLQRAVVSEQWFKRIQAYKKQERINPSGLPFNVWCWVRKESDVEKCPLHISCHLCGLVFVCDKKEHNDCSKVLVARLERHLSTCKLNVTAGSTYFVLGYAFTIEGDRIVNQDGMKCENKTNGHKCWQTSESMELGDKDVTKRRQHYAVFSDDGRANVYFKKVCVDSLLKGLKVRESCLDFDCFASDLRNYVDVEIAKVKALIDGNLHNTNQCCDKVMYLSKGVQDVEGMLQLFDKKLDETILAMTRHTDQLNDLNSLNVVLKTRVDLLENEPTKEVLDWTLTETPSVQPVEPEVKSKRQRRKKRGGTPATSDGEEKVVQTSNGFQLIVSNLNGRHDELVGDCHCPRCQCDNECECPICVGKACIWCNEVGHATRDCSHAKSRTCYTCSKSLPNWFSESMVVPNEGKCGYKTLCCNNPKKCIVCATDGHHPLSCPIIRHASISKKPEDVSTFGFNSNIVATLVMPPPAMIKQVKFKKKEKIDRNGQNFS